MKMASTSYLGSLPYQLGALRFGNGSERFLFFRREIWQFVLRILRRSIHQISIWTFVNERLQNDYDVGRLARFVVLVLNLV
ncbi:hypothetical protein RCL_jg1090.t1 [Rhizophagus clarus]|uniref:Uncharacterized protein n=1 Tax=Rhizophagus clarus TaxID=94130 RepID=A0A8H3R2P7_9GLOM|nr:hypothetical protein RCL_jg1090.t1 [Rhizophagus clarus]